MLLIAIIKNQILFHKVHYLTHKNSNIMKKPVLFLFAVTVLLSACNTGQKPKSGETEDLSDKIDFQLVEQWRTDTILRIPESVFYDEEGKVLYVSNIVSIDTPDGVGFISKVDLEGNILDLEWVTGLTFTKGMAKVGDKLYVTELKTVVEIDIPSASITQRFLIDSAIFLNDLTSDQEGNLYVSDSRGNAIYKISKGVVSVVLDDGLVGPNGLLLMDDRLLLTSDGKLASLEMGIGEQKLSVLADSILRGDGIADTGIPGHYLVTSWLGQVFMVYPDHTKASLLYTEDQGINTADIDFAIDPEIIFVPTFFGNNVVAYKLVRK